jgi:hypothetical protein
LKAVLQKYEEAHKERKLYGSSGAFREPVLATWGIRSKNWRQRLIDHFSCRDKERHLPRNARRSKPMLNFTAIEILL